MISSWTSSCTSMLTLLHNDVGPAAAPLQLACTRRPSRGHARAGVARSVAAACLSGKDWYMSRLLPEAAVAMAWPVKVCLAASAASLRASRAPPKMLSFGPPLGGLLPEPKSPAPVLLQCSKDD